MIVILISVLVLWACKVIYSMYFSPLRSIPGPLLLQVFPIYHSITLALGTNHLLLLKYHLSYGPIFRTGWDSVVCVDPTATLEIMNNYEKAPNYSIFSYFGENIFSTQDKQFHAARSRLVSPSLRKGSVNAMEPLIHTFIDQAAAQIGSYAKMHEAVDFFLLLHNMTYDIIGRLVFGQTFGMLESGSHPIVGWMIKGLAITLLALAVPALRFVPNIYNEKVREFIKTAIKSCDHSHTPPPIISSYIKSVDRLTGDQLPSDAVVSEAFILLLAGTESTSNTILWVLYHIAKHPHVRTLVEDELRQLKADNRISFDDYQHRLPYLQAVVKESMRLLPAVSGVGLRQIPSPGRTLLGHFLPGGTIVGVSSYALHRSPKLWGDADQFKPERWINSKPPKRGSYIPFYIGPRACTGQHLANQIIALTAANLLNRFQLTLVDPLRDPNPKANPVMKPHPNNLFMSASPWQSPN
ncbi:hypothetical protein DSO57_1000656 [Entomophthora muscae]|uniref:Uncharacterized protein n=1 Tax=Entomophthora muscae TaxID=34485 RepID=A0ACC2TX34_9FUNG|nr:hypothetical protein DSO57_1000656 [Entomophthora muscae]